MSGTVAFGHALVATGAVVVYVSAALDGAVRELRTTRRVGRAVLAVAGWLVHPLVALHRRLGEPPAARCVRRGHDPVDDGRRLRCARCDRRALEVYVDGPLDPDADVLRAAIREEWVYPDDPRVVPGSILPPTSPSGVSSRYVRRFGLELDAARLRADVVRLERDLTRTERLEPKQRRDELGRRRSYENPWWW